MLASCGEQSTEKAASASVTENETAASPVQAGRRAFSECAVCHSARQGAPHRVGPNLFDIVGQNAGTRDGFAYSSAMRNSGVIWSRETLDAYIDNPQAFIRGNRMSYTGQPDSEKRRAIIDYLESLSAPE